MITGQEFLVVSILDYSFAISILNFVSIAFNLCNLIVGSDPISYNCLFAKGMQTASFFIIGIRRKLFGFRSDFIG